MSCVICGKVFEEGEKPGAKWMLREGLPGFIFEACAECAEREGIKDDFTSLSDEELGKYYYFVEVDEIKKEL